MATLIGAIILAGACLRSGHDPRFVGRWSFTPDGAAPTAEFVLFEDGTGTSANTSAPVHAPLRWCTTGGWLIFDDPPADTLTRCWQWVSHVAVQLSGTDLRGRVECLKVLRVDENTIQVQNRVVKATLRRVVE